MDNIKRFTFRIPNDLWTEVKKRADKNRRSVTSELVIAIEEYLKNNPK